MRLFGVFFVVMLLLQPSAQAQRTTMTNGNGGANFVGMDKLNDPTKEMLRRFIDASRLTLTGNGQLLAALGQDQEAAFMRERAYSAETGHLFRRKLDTRSSENWTPVPGQTGHLGRDGAGSRLWFYS